MIDHFHFSSLHFLHLPQVYILNGHESGQTPGDSEGQGSLACSPMGSQRAGHNLMTE